MMKVLPLFALALMVFGCGGGAGDPQSIGDDALDMFLAKDFNSIHGLTDSDWEDEGRSSEVREWMIEEEYTRWKDWKEQVKKWDPEKESGVEDEESWKAAGHDVHFALRKGLYKVLEVDEINKRLEAPWCMMDKSVNLKIEGQGSASMTYGNGYGDTLNVECVRRNGTWYLTGIRADFEKEVPKKPKDE